jgi:hypothetical protein
MTVSATNNTAISTQLQNQPNARLTPASNAWMKAIVSAVKGSDLVDGYSTSKTTEKAYSLNISQKSLEMMNYFKDLEVVTINEDALAYTKNLKMEYNPWR